MTQINGKLLHPHRLEELILVKSTYYWKQSTGSIQCLSKPNENFHTNIRNNKKYVSVCPCVLSHVQLVATLWTAALQAPLSMGFSRQEYWSRLPFPAPGELPNPGIEPASLASSALAGRFFITLSSGKTPKMCMKPKKHQIIKIILRKKNKAGGLILPILKL